MCKLCHNVKYPELPVFETKSDYLYPGIGQVYLLLVVGFGRLNALSHCLKLLVRCVNLSCFLVQKHDFQKLYTYQRVKTRRDNEVLFSLLFLDILLHSSRLLTLSVVPLNIHFLIIIFLIFSARVGPYDCFVHLLHFTWKEELISLVVEEGMVHIYSRSSASLSWLIQQE